MKTEIDNILLDSERTLHTRESHEYNLDLDAYKPLLSVVLGCGNSLYKNYKGELQESKQNYLQKQEERFEEGGERVTAKFGVLIVSTVSIVGVKIMSILMPEDKWIYTTYAAGINAAFIMLIL
ncbi:hypothetical protein [Senimuribacter intestinalis]|uniref:hypothetical protein n=1 Tax=Senimuribacter intestinalis TaxID=2941507 RepID=UPI002041AF7A|nr:hypothetical protein [Senimuribacter intestinalis]